MKKVFLMGVVLTMGWSICAVAKVGTVDNTHQELAIVGDFESGIVLDGPITDVKEFLEGAVTSGVLDFKEEEIASSLLSSLDGVCDSDSVLIQPMGTKTQYQNNLIYDTYVDEGNPGSNYGTSGDLFIGCYYNYLGLNLREERGFFCCFDCPTGGVVNWADLIVYIEENDLDTTRYFYLGRATSGWSETGVTWSNQPSADNTQYDYMTNTCEATFCTFYVDNPVKAVCNSGYINYGLKVYGDSAWASNLTCSATWYYPNENIRLGTYEDGRTSYMLIDYTYSELSDFSATAQDGKVVIKWSTSYEANNAGWNIYRAIGKSGGYVKLNEPIIPPYQYSYEFIDEAVDNGITYCYKLEAVDLDGSAQRFGPKCATPSAKISAEIMGAELSGGDSTSESMGGCGW